jgi:hypothetical protein
MTNLNTPTVETQMMIRKPVSSVFEAFMDPAVTTEFWFTKSSGKLQAGKTILCDWEMYEASAVIKVKQIILNHLISLEWGEPATLLDLHYTSLNDTRSYVEIKNQTGGFTKVLDGLKAYLESGIKRNLVEDKFPPICQK